MLGLERGQRVALSDTVRDLANLVAAALVLGQFVGERPFSWWLMVSGAATWMALVLFGTDSGKEPRMMTAFGMLGIIIAFVAIIVFLDWWASKKDRQSRDRAA